MQSLSAHRHGDHLAGGGAGEGGGGTQNIWRYLRLQSRMTSDETGMTQHSQKYQVGKSWEKMDNVGQIWGKRSWSTLKENLKVTKLKIWVSYIFYV